MIFGGICTAGFLTSFDLVVVVALYCHLVTSTSEISHQPAHTYTTYIYDKGVDKTGRQGIEGKYSITRGK